TGTVGNVGTVSFLGENTETDWRGQVAASVTKIKGSHSFKGGAEYIHDYATQKFGFNQFGTWQISGTSAQMLEILSVGGPTANRFDAAGSTAFYQKQIGNLDATMSGDAIAAYFQDNWKMTPNFTLNYGMRWEGSLYPTPDANNNLVLGPLNGYVFPSGRT